MFCSGNIPKDMSYTERVDPVWMEKGAGPPSDFDVDTIGNPVVWGITLDCRTLVKWSLGAVHLRLG